MGTSILDFWQGEVWRTLALLVATVALVAVSHSVWVMVTRHWWMPRRLGHIMKQQGWKGPPFRLGVGSLPEVVEFVNKQGSSPLAIRNFDTVPTIIPQYALFSKRYGDKCFYYQGSELRIVVTNPNLVKEIFSNPFQYGRFDVKTMKTRELIGQFGLPTINGEEWVLHRQLLEPAFHMESIKGMVSTMMKCTASLLQTWEQKVRLGKGEVELEINNEMRITTADIIAHTAFSINYEKGKQVFTKMDNLILALSKAYNNPFFWIPGYRFLPTTNNTRIAKLKFEINEGLKQLVQGRLDMARKGKVPYGNDLLGLMLLAFDQNKEKDTKMNKHESLQALVDECKTFFAAGSETVASLLTWTLLLLAEYFEWQDSARIEILELCGGNINNLDASMISKMKIVGMILNETSRLFTVVPSFLRIATQDIQLGDIFVPKGSALDIPAHQIHRDPKLWGDDAFTFNPHRFAKGVSQACKHPQGFLPFSFGPRYCIGQNFANTELKIVLAMVLSQFQLSISPNYKHCPRFMLTQRPLYGLQLIVKSLTNLTS